MCDSHFDEYILLLFIWRTPICPLRNNSNAASPEKPSWISTGKAGPSYIHHGTYLPRVSLSILDSFSPPA